MCQEDLALEIVKKTLKKKGGGLIELTLKAIKINK